MLKIRLQRVGRKHEPVFRLVVVDSHMGPKSGKFIEILGNYDSRRGEKAEFNADRIKHWLSVGAQTSGTVNNLLISKKIIEGEKINVLPKKKPIFKESEGGEKAEGAKEAAAPASDTPAPEVKAEEAPKAEEKPVEEKTPEEAPKEEKKEEPKAPEAPKEEAPQPEPAKEEEEAKTE